MSAFDQADVRLTAAMRYFLRFIHVPAVPEVAVSTGHLAADEYMNGGACAPGAARRSAGHRAC